MAKQPSLRLHFIPEWAEARGLRQADIVEALQEAGTGVDKSTVSRWFSGNLPEERHILALQGLFALNEPARPVPSPGRRLDRGLLPQALERGALPDAENAGRTLSPAPSLKPLIHNCL